MRRLFGRRARGRDDDDPRVDDYAAPDQAVNADDDDAEYGTDEFEAFVPVEREYDTYEAFEDVNGEDHDTDDALSYGPAYEPYEPPPYTAEGDAGVGVPEPPETGTRRRRLRVPRVPLPHAQGGNTLRWDALLLAVALVALGIFGTLLVQDQLSGDIVEWWPVGLVAVALVWMLVALVRRHVTSFLGATALAGIGLSALMDAQDIARFDETLLGVVLVMLGLGIVMRGFLLRQRDVT